MKINNSEVKNYMTMKFNFSGIRIYESSLNPVDWELKVNLVGVEPDDTSNANIQELGSIAYQKIFFWLDTNLTNVVIADVDDEIGFNICNIVDNFMLYSPGEPSDDLLIQLLHSKLCEIGGKNIHIGEMNLSSSDTSASYTYSGPDILQGPFLPQKTIDYISLESLYEKPWWKRKDGFCFEFVRMDAENDDPLDVMFSDVIDPLAEFEKSLLNKFNDTDIEDPAEIIQVDTWKPTTV